jgi:poly-gamma-glutamate capsule biosynthesis protein CapA/YwtB (metallophosphatase superfamily)
MVDFVTAAAWSRFPGLRKLAVRRVTSTAREVAIPDTAARIVFGGDVNFDPEIRTMWNLGLQRVNYQTPPERSFGARVKRKLWRRFANRFLSGEYFNPMDEDFDEFTVGAPDRADVVRPDAFSTRTRRVEVDWAAVGADPDFPFRRIAPFFKSRDLVILNLETPLSTHPRDNGLFKSHPAYAKAIKDAGVSLLILSNNHIFDAGEPGFLDTLAALERAGLQVAGVGSSLEEARKGAWREVKGTKLCLLSYTQYCNSRFASLASGCPGILPLDRRMMIEDIRAARPKADVLAVSVHWGIENQPAVHPVQIEIARQLVDAGADAVVGHHPHVPHGIEIYRNRPIVYSLGNFIFAQRNHPGWKHNFLAELVVDGRDIRALVVYPVAGDGARLFQPELLQGSEADAALSDLQMRSIPFKTAIHVRDGTGYVRTQ